MNLFCCCWYDDHEMDSIILYCSIFWSKSARTLRHSQQERPPLISCWPLHQSSSFVHTILKHKKNAFDWYTVQCVFIQQIIEKKPVRNSLRNLWPYHLGHVGCGYESSYSLFWLYKLYKHTCNKKNGYLFVSVSVYGPRQDKESMVEKTNTKNNNWTGRFFWFN